MSIYCFESFKVKVSKCLRKGSKNTYFKWNNHMIERYQFVCFPNSICLIASEVALKDMPCNENSSITGHVNLRLHYWDYIFEIQWNLVMLYCIRVQNFVVIGWAYFKPDHFEVWSNFKWNTVSGTGAWYPIISPSHCNSFEDWVSHEISLRWVAVTHQ